MAVGDITALAIAANGTQVSFTIEGLTAASITGFESGKAATLACTSEGYSGTTLGTAARAGIRTQFVSAVDSSGDAIVTLAPEESIHDDDVDVVVSIDDGAFNDGSNGSAEVVEGAVTNNSELDYALPMCLIVSKTFSERAVTTFAIDVAAHAGAYRGYQPNLGIAAVTVEACEAITVSSPGTFTAGEIVSDGTRSATLVKQVSTLLYIKDLTGAGAWSGTITGADSSATATFVSGGRAVVKTTTALEAIARYGSRGHRESWLAFHTEFDVSTSGGDWTGGPQNKDWLVITAKAYPQIGDADAIRSQLSAYIYANPADDYDTHVAYVDSRGTATLTAGLTNTLADGTVVTGDASGAIAYLAGSHAAGVTALTLTHIKGTFTADEQLNFNDAIAVVTESKNLSGSPVWNGDDATGTVDDDEAPFLTAYKAGRACQNASSDSTASWSTLYVMGSASHKGRVSLGTYAFGDVISTHHGPIIIAADPAADAATNCVVGGKSDSNGFKTHLLRIDCDIDVPTDTSVAGIVKGGATWNNTGIVGGGAGLDTVLNGCFITGKHNDRAIIGTTSWGDIHSHFGGGYTTVKNARCELSDGGVVRDLTTTNCAGDAYRPDKKDHGNGVFNNNLSHGVVGSTAHADLYQFVGGAAGTVYENHAWWWNWAHDLQNVQGAPFANTTDNILRSISMVGNIQEDCALIQIDGPLTTSWFIAHNYFGVDILLRNAFTEANAWWTRNIFTGFNSSNEAVSAGKVANHFIDDTSTMTAGFDRTEGGDTDTLFVDYDNDNYHPVAGSVLDVTFDEDIVPADAYGDDPPVIGALTAETGEAEPSTPGPGLLSSPFRF